MPCDWKGTGWRHEFNDSGIKFTNELVTGREELVLERDVEVGEWSAPADKAAAYTEIAEKMRQNVTTIWARVGFGGVIQPAVTASAPTVTKHGVRTYWWAASLLIAVLLATLDGVNSTQHMDLIGNSPPGGSLITSDGNLIVDRNSHSTFVAAPEAHLNSFNRAVDSSLESCVDTGRDHTGPFFHSSCRISARVRVLRLSGDEPFDVTIAPGEKSYVYFLQSLGSEAVGMFAVCPAADQIVDSRSGLPWRVRGAGYRCQHSLE